MDIPMVCGRRGRDGAAPRHLLDSLRLSTRRRSFRTSCTPCAARTTSPWGRQGDGRRSPPPGVDTSGRSGHWSGDEPLGGLASLAGCLRRWMRPPNGPGGCLSGSYRPHPGR